MNPNAAYARYWLAISCSSVAPNKRETCNRIKKCFQIGKLWETSNWWSFFLLPQEIQYWPDDQISHASAISRHPNQLTHGKISSSNTRWFISMCDGNARSWSNRFVLLPCQLETGTCSVRLGSTDRREYPGCIPFKSGIFSNLVMGGTSILRQRTVQITRIMMHDVVGYHSYVLKSELAFLLLWHRYHLLLGHRIYNISFAFILHVWVWHHAPRPRASEWVFCLDPLPEVSKKGHELMLNIKLLGNCGSIFVCSRWLLFCLRAGSIHWRSNALLLCRFW